MIILGIDTSGQQGSVALLRAEAGELRTLESASIAGGRYSELLVPAISDLLARHGLARKQIDLIAVASGPGSFTGLRVAIATVKGLAEAFGMPVITVSVLQAVAQVSGQQGRVLAVLDAQRSEIFYAEYEVHTGDPVLLRRENIAKIADLETLISPGCHVVTPDPSVANRVPLDASAIHVVPRPSAEVFAEIGYRKFLAEGQTDVATLDANYVRRSDAELVSAPKLGIPLA